MDRRLDIDKYDIGEDRTTHMVRLLNTPIEDLDISVRTYNSLKAAEIHNLANLVRYKMDELSELGIFKYKSLAEIECPINEMGLSFGMDVSKYGF